MATESDQTAIDTIGDAWKRALARAEKAEAERDTARETIETLTADAANREDAWKESLRIVRGLHEAEQARLRAALAEVLALFGDIDSLKAITPDEAAHVRKTSLLRPATVADVYRWHSALAGAPEGTEPAAVCTCYVAAFTRVQHVTSQREDCPVHGTLPAPPAAPLHAALPTFALPALEGNRAIERSGAEIFQELRQTVATPNGQRFGVVLTSGNAQRLIDYVEARERRDRRADPLHAAPTLLTAAAHILRECAKHIESLSVGYGEQQMKSIATELDVAAAAGRAALLASTEWWGVIGPSGMPCLFGKVKSDAEEGVDTDERVALFRVQEIPTPEAGAE